MLPDEQPGPDQMAVFRRMTPEQRWNAANNMYWPLRRHKAALLRTLHPEWTEEQVQVAVREAFLHART
jgi:hypothetical protein